MLTELYAGSFLQFQQFRHDISRKQHPDYSVQGRDLNQYVQSFYRQRQHCRHDSLYKLFRRALFQEML